MYIPAKENLNKVNELLTGELSGAAGIKSKQTRTSVCSAITSTKESKFDIMINQNRTKTIS
jgi:peptide subunit release factor 1 (eRF1)